MNDVNANWFASIGMGRHGQSDFEPDFREEALEAFALTPHNVALAVGRNTFVSTPLRPCKGAGWVAVARRR